MHPQCTTSDCDNARYCKGLCRLHYDRQYREANREKIRLYLAAYHQTHREAHDANNLRWASLHREEMLAANRRYHAAHREEAMEKNRLYYAAHREEHLARGKRWAATHREERRIIDARGRKARPEAIREQAHRGHARRRAAFVAPVSLKAIYERDKGRCGICRKLVPLELASLDHILPLAAGGTHEPVNVRITHRHCNYSRQHRGPAQLRLMA